MSALIKNIMSYQDKRAELDKELLGGQILLIEQLLDEVRNGGGDKATFTFWYDRYSTNRQFLESVTGANNFKVDRESKRVESLNVPSSNIPWIEQINFIGQTSQHLDPISNALGMEPTEFQGFEAIENGFKLDTSPANIAVFVTGLLDFYQITPDMYENMKKMYAENGSEQGMSV